MDLPPEAVDETTESVNPLDPSASGPFESTINENASIEPLIKVSQDMARVFGSTHSPEWCNMKAWSGRIPWYKYGRVR